MDPSEMRKRLKFRKSQSLDSLEVSLMQFICWIHLVCLTKSFGNSLEVNPATMKRMQPRTGQFLFKTENVLLV